MYVWAGRPAFAWPYVGVHKSTSLMSSSLLPQQSPIKENVIQQFLHSTILHKHKFYQDHHQLAYLLTSTKAVWYQANFTAVMFVFLHSCVFGKLPHFLCKGLTDKRLIKRYIELFQRDFSIIKNVFHLPNQLHGTYCFWLWNSTYAKLNCLIYTFNCV